MSNGLLAEIAWWHGNLRASEEFWLCHKESLSYSLPPSLSASWGKEPAEAAMGGLSFLLLATWRSPEERRRDLRKAYRDKVCSLLSQSSTCSGTGRLLLAMSTAGKRKIRIGTLQCSCLVHRSWKRKGVYKEKNKTGVLARADRRLGTGDWEKIWEKHELKAQLKVRIGGPPGCALGKCGCKRGQSDGGGDQTYAGLRKLRKWNYLLRKSVEQRKQEIM